VRDLTATAQEIEELLQQAGPLSAREIATATGLSLAQVDGALRASDSVRPTSRGGTLIWHLESMEGAK
jgi:hypothetical protein